jgi:orotidine-5'-phosphate decarboxylase
MNPILVALDLDTADAALAMASKVRGRVGGLKVGSHLFTSEGPALVRALVERGDRVFLDLKFHDIPNTVASAVGAAASLGVWMLNVHASGGLKMMQAAKEAADRARDGTGRRPLLIAVTVLTSFDQAMLEGTGVNRPIPAQVEHLAAPDDPAPRIGRRGGRSQQGQPGDGGTGDEQGPRGHRARKSGRRLQRRARIRKRFRAFGECSPAGSTASATRR